MLWRSTRSEQAWLLSGAGPKLKAMASLTARIDHALRPNGRVFHGWWLVLGAAGIQLLSGLLFMHSVGAYVVALQRDFGWSSTLVAAAFALTRAESGLLGPLQGYLVDRFGPRVILRIGLVVFAAGFLLFALTDSVFLFYFSWALIAAGSGLSGFGTLTVAIVHWFDRHRAKAVAISQLGFSVGGLCVPIVFLSLQLVGWRWTAVISAVVVMLVGLPLVQLVHHRPAAKGEVRDGTARPLGTAGHQQVPQDRDLTAKEAVRTSAFWMISCGHGLALLTVSTTMAHLATHLTRGLDFTLLKASFVVSLMTACQVTGQLLGGWLGDRYDKRLLCVGCMLAHGAGFGCLALADGDALVVAFALLHGFGWGVRGPLMVALRADYFGAASFGTIMGYSSLVAAVGMMTGALFAGAMADLFGDFVLAFALLGTAAAIGAVLFAAAKRPPRTPRSA